jgi:ACS family tartrate transporter-like MFS transporter
MGVLLHHRPIDGAVVIGKIARRTVPLLAVLYIVSFLDRVNIGFAALTMNRELGISATVYGWAAGVFFCGYLLFQVPSNLALLRFGPRRWLACILLAWGLISMSMALVHSGTGLIGVRFLLGLAEAGFFPGVILYLTRWFPQQYRARIIAGFMFAIPVSSIIGAPLSGLILKTMAGSRGLSSWQWLFILESLPALAGAGAILLLLPDRPDTASWLSAAERAWLQSQQPSAQRPSAQQPLEPRHGIDALRAGFNTTVLLLSLGYFGLTIGLYGVGLWLPQIVAQSGTTPFITGVLTAVPYLFAAAGMLLWGRTFDRRGGGIVYAALPGLLCAASLAISTLFHALPLQLLFLTLTTIGIMAGLATFWAYATRILPVLGVAIAIAVINSMGNMGGFLGPVLIGWIKDATHSFQAGLLAVAALTLGGTCLLFPTRGRLSDKQVTACSIVRRKSANKERMR